MEVAQFSRHKMGKLSQKMNNHHAYPYGKGVLITNLEELFLEKITNLEELFLNLMLRNGHYACPNKRNCL